MLFDEYDERRKTAFDPGDPPDAPEPDDPPTITCAEATEALDGLRSFLDGENTDDTPLVALEMPFLWLDTLRLFVEQHIEFEQPEQPDADMEANRAARRHAQEQFDAWPR